LPTGKRAVALLVLHRTKNCAFSLDGAQKIVHDSSMTKRAKLLDKLMEGRHDKSFSFAEVEQLLSQAGFLFDLGSGSHRVYRHPDGRRMALPYHGTDVKPAYIKQIRELLRP
jgi:predicted RNA binding protein YcfA (HicA-like mRNA interferase family)